MLASLCSVKKVSNSSVNYFYFTVSAQGVQFVSGLSDTVANTGKQAELSCKLSSEDAKGCWYKNGKLVS